MSESEEWYKKIIPATSGWYLRIYKEGGFDSVQSVHPIAAWAQLPSNRVVALWSASNKSTHAELMPPPPHYYCDYITQEQLTDTDRLLLRR